MNQPSPSHQHLSPADSTTNNLGIDEDDNNNNNTNTNSNTTASAAKLDRALAAIAPGLVLELPHDSAEQEAWADQAGMNARVAARKLAILPTASRNEALTSIHKVLSNHRDVILMANEMDVVAARAAGMDAAELELLDLSPRKKFEEMLQGIVDVRAMDDPVGAVDRAVLVDDGLVLKRSSCPIGVLFAIFEACPEALTNITSLALKSGNAIVLNGASEASNTIKALAAAIRNGLEFTAVSVKSVQVVVGTDDRVKPVVGRLLGMDKFIDLVIPRGRQSLVDDVKKRTHIPVLGHAAGICTAYLRADCAIDVATRVVYDSKVSVPGACNSIEMLLVDADALGEGCVFEPVARELLRAGCVLYCDGPSRLATERVAHALMVDEEIEEELAKKGKVSDMGKADDTEGTTEIVPTTATATTTATAHTPTPTQTPTLGRRLQQIKEALPHHYQTEFLTLALAIKTTVDTDDAIQHINTYSSHHTDVILTRDDGIAAHFLDAVDSAGVFWNASTRIANGHRYGFGAEVGISTNKVHARGPVGLEGLTIHKWIMCGSGHCAADYGPGLKVWKHGPVTTANLDELPASVSSDIRRFLQ